MMQFRNFDVDAFLRDTWQKRPLLIRNPWDAWSNPLDPDELAGLACERQVESRLIERQADGWSVEHGPLPEARFAALGAHPWTLLVQAVDHHAPEVAALIEPFRFIPNWRIDDVMVSYAADRAGVGPHYDQYDVFLIQGLGRRRWRVGPLCDADSPLIAHDDLRLLADFEPTQEFVLEPGDILYVPPRFAHDGIAEGDDCMTYSVGFRAPSHRELIAEWCDHALADLDDDLRYADPDLLRQDNPGEIAASAIDRLQAIIAETLLDREGLVRWFGASATASKYPEIDWRPDAPTTPAEARERTAQGALLRRNPASRFAFVREGAGDAPRLLLFVDGESLECVGPAADLAEALCGQDVLDLGADLDDAAAALLVDLVNRGAVAFDEDDD